MSRSIVLPSIGWCRDRPVLRPVNADELLDHLAALPGVRRVPSAAPIRAAVAAAGIEIAAVGNAAEQVLRRTWKGRVGGGATPLLLIASDISRPDCVLTLGPADGAPLRSVDAAALADVLRRVSTRPRLDAVRELAGELDRLDQAGIPGLKIRELLTQHTLNVRMRRDTERWGRAQVAVKAIARGSDWRAVLTALGYELERRRNRGYLARHEGRPVAVVHPVDDPAKFSRLDADGRPPEGVLINDCQSDGAAFGILASGSRLRLFHTATRAGSATARYLDLDAAALQDDDRPFLALLGPEFLAGGELDALIDEARTYV